MMFSCQKESSTSWSIMNQLTGSLVSKDTFGDNRPTLIFDMEKGLMNPLFTVFVKDTSYVNCAMHLLKNLKRLVGIEKYRILGENFRTLVETNDQSKALNAHRVFLQLIHEKNRTLKNLTFLTVELLLHQFTRAFRKECTFERLNSNFVEQQNVKVLRLRDNSVVPAVSSIF